MTAAATPPDPARHVSDLINGFWAAQVINAAVSLRLPDHLAVGPRTAEDLAGASGAHAPSVYRLMRALVTLGLCVPAGEGRFVLSEAGQLLRADAPGSVRGRALFTGDMLWKQFGDLLHVVKTGGVTTTMASGEEGFAALAADPPRLHAFQQAMAESSRTAARGAIQAYDFSRFASVLDLGGGYGGVLAELLNAHAGLAGAVCDLAYLETGALGFLAAAGVAARARFIGGSFFEQVPEGFDLILMKFIIHDWDDERARMILANARRAAGTSVTLVLLEQIAPDDLALSGADQAVIRGDLTMMTMGGKERTREEYQTLMDQTGWRLTSVTPTASGFGVIEATPA